VDQPIVVNELEPPEGNYDMNEEETMSFSIDAYDPDGNDLEYSWQLDGEEVSTVASYDFITTWQSGEADYVITLSVTDNYGTADNTLDFTWNVHVNDTVDSGPVLLPVITSLNSNYPNPLTSTTSCYYQLEQQLSESVQSGYHDQLQCERR